ncbi:MAG: anhydro-N-acetylmuramic acid kinase [Burkholderiaceae bacterium]
MSQRSNFAIIGVMSGTSFDAIDAAWVDFSDSGQPVVVDFESSPMSQALRSSLFKLQSPSFSDLHQSQLVAIQHADETAQVVCRLIDRQQRYRSSLRAVAIHGQTVRHQPKLGYTVQLLAGAYLAENIAVDVIGDFRSADIACGGEGAPLVPAFHQAVFAADEPVAVVNVGGIANISLLIPGEPARGYDTGPGNLLMDGWINKSLGMPFDEDGRWARQGNVDPELFDALKADTYFAKAAPKSTGRDWFHESWVDEKLQTIHQSVAAVDVQRSLLELTAWSIARACEDWGVRKIWICGGGARNGLLLEVLASLVAVPVASTSELHIDPQQVEACAFAWFGYCFLNRRTASLPTVTGARRAKLLGALWPAS